MSYDSWWLAWLGVPSAIREVTVALEAMIAAAGGSPLRPAGLLSPVEAEARKRPAVAAYVGMDVLWRDPQKIEECLRAALDASCRSRLFEDYPSLDVQGSGLAQIACLAARERLWRTREADEGLVAVAELAAGVALLRDLPVEKTVRTGLTFLRAGLDRLAENAGEIPHLVAELKIGSNLVRECLGRSVEMEFPARKQAVEMASEAFDRGLLSEESNPDEYRWAVASEAELNRIATHYTESKALLKTVDLTRPFDDMAIAGTVRWIVGVIQGETGDWQAALRSLDEALLLVEEAEDTISATKVRVSRAVVLVYCGIEAAFDQFRICLEKSEDSLALRFSVMANLIITKSYLSLSAELPFDFEEFVAVARHSDEMKAWIPFCKALMETRPRIACDLFLRASTEFEVTTQVMPATTAVLLAAMEAAKDDQPTHAYQLGVKAAMTLRTSQVFGGRLALAAETFLASLDSKMHFSDRVQAFLRKVQMPYLQ